MNCGQARRALWPPERPRLAEAEVLEARAHVRACPACESYFAQDRGLLEAYDRASRERAPQALRERVFDSLARERSKSLEASASSRPRLSPVGLVPRRWVLVFAVSVAALLAGGGVALLQSARENPNDGGLFAEDYLRRAVGQERIVSSDALEVSRFLTRELGRPISPLRLTGLRLISAEVCLIEGRRGAMIQYLEDGREILHYLIPREGTPGREPGLASAWGSDANTDRPALVTWATPEIEQALVGEVPAAHLMELVRNASL